eukprot:6279014-Amphidinium_carterae.1
MRCVQEVAATDACGTLNETEPTPYEILTNAARSLRLLRVCLDCISTELTRPELTIFYNESAWAIFSVQVRALTIQQT